MKQRWSKNMAMECCSKAPSSSLPNNKTWVGQLICSKLSFLECEAIYVRSSPSKGRGGSTQIFPRKEIFGILSKQLQKEINGCHLLNKSVHIIRNCHLKHSSSHRPKLTLHQSNCLLVRPAGYPEHHPNPLGKSQITVFNFQRFCFSF